MKKQIVIVGGGIVGSTAAYYLAKNQHLEVTLIDQGIGTATRAAAGIICPWLSQRRNKDWYRLTAHGADFYLKLMDDLNQEGITQLPYKPTGTLVFKNKPQLLEKLYSMAKDRQNEAKMIGDLAIYDSINLQRIIPQLETHQGAVLTSGGGRVDGSALLDCLQELFVKKGGKMVTGNACLMDTQRVKINEQILHFDQIILSVGAWLPQLLHPLDYNVDIKPQKGQLLEVETDFQTDHWPGCMLHGEIDILPFDEGKLVIGASHENDMGFDLSIDQEMIKNMKQTATSFMPALADYAISKTRVGTRAYTSDFLPFYGNLKDHKNIWVASGLGSSGLTSGPFIGWQIAQEILESHSDFDRTSYTPDKYIEKIEES